MDYGRAIRELRVAAGVSQSRLADHMGVLRNDELSRCEGGQRAMTEAEFLRGKAALLEIIAQREAAFEEACKVVSA
jgi:transcriptional regulator with XRE-family HTH domain